MKDAKCAGCGRKLVQPRSEKTNWLASDRWCQQCGGSAQTPLKVRS